MEDSIQTVLSDVSRMLRRAFNERTREIGVTSPQWIVLNTLTMNEGTNQGGLADILGIEPITLCRILDRLQDAELIERRRDPADRRAWRLFITAKAKDLLEDLHPVGEEIMALALDGLSEAERDQFRDLLTRMRQNLSRRAEAPGTNEP